VEIDQNDRVVERFKCRHGLENYTIDKFDRLILWDNDRTVNFLDSDLNEIYSSVALPFEMSPRHVYYNRTRHELVCLFWFDYDDTILRTYSLSY